VHGPGYQDRGVCGVAETPVVAPQWHVVCFRLCLIFVPQLCPALMLPRVMSMSRRSFSSLHVH